MIHHQKTQQARSKIKHFNLILILVFVISALYPISHIYAALSCTVSSQATCNSNGHTTVLRMSGNTNAHAELPSQSNVNYNANVVCCSGISSIGNSCTGNFQRIVRLSGVTNAHVQETSVNTYGSSACLSDAVGNNTITIGYQNTNCSGYDTTLFSMIGNPASPADNATVGDGSAYTRKVCATIIEPTISFDLDTGTSGSTENGPTYTVPLGTLPLGSVTVSGGSINMIIAEGETNAAGGMVVTVQNANGANGLVSASVPADKIPSATQTPITAGTAGYGLCVATSGLTGFSRASSSPDYSSGTCALSASNNAIKQLSTTPVQMLNSGGAALSGGHAEIVVNAAISPTTPAHNDYEDTLTFIATGTF